jgi:POT family proton-dependent oligopeptide transporter
VVLFIVAMTAGELYILPVGLGLFGHLAPKGLTATSIAVWFSAGVLGNLFAGWLGTLWSPLTHTIFFAIIGAVALSAASLLALLAPKVTSVEKSV